MDKKKSWSRKILILFFALLLVLALVFILYGMIRASINSNAIIRESSFIASSANIIQGLISEWKLNEEILNGTVGEVKDNVMGRNLTAQSGVSVKEEGIDGRSAEFNGQSGFIYGNYNIDFELLTVSFWFNTKDAHSIKRIVEHGWNADGSNSGVFTTHFDNGVLYTGLTFGDGTQIFLASNDLIFENKWYHYVLTYNGSAAKIYLDGELKGFIITNKPLRKVNKNLIAGGTYEVIFNGTIDNLMIYNKALNNDEIGSLYAEQFNNLIVPSSAGVKLVKTCQNITSSGKYELGKNLLNQEIPLSGCIVINASNSELNCNGKSIVNTTLNAAGILIKNAKNVSIKNCNIQMNNTNKLSRGFLILNSNNISLINNAINNNYLGIEIIDSGDSAIVNNTINANSYYGVSLVKSDGAFISGNNLNYNSIGLFVSSNDNKIIKNTVKSNINQGILLFLTNFSKLSFNKLNENGLDGMTISLSDNNSFLDNNLSGNMRDGILLNTSDNNLIDNNYINNNRYGVSLIVQSNNNNITRNNVWGNSMGTIYDEEGNIGNIIIDNFEVFYPESCKNGDLDFNEEEIDCGGLCADCHIDNDLINSLDLNIGVSKSMLKNDKLEFIFDSQVHKLELFDLYVDSANLIFDINSSFNLSIGEKVKIDINEDEIFDLLLFMFSLNSSNIEIYLQSISEPAVFEDNNIEEPQEEDVQNENNETDNFDSLGLEEFTSQKNANETKVNEKSTFLKNNYSALIILGLLLLMVVIILIIWIKTTKAELVV